MTGPTRPSSPLSVNALLAIAALCATASVLVVPKASLDPARSAAGASGSTVQQEPAVSPSQVELRAQRALSANLRAIGQEASVVFGAFGAVADAVSG